MSLFGEDFSVKEIDKAAAESPSGARGVFFHPFAQGSPNFDPQFKGAFIGLTSAHSRNDLSRAVLEGVCFSLADAFRLLQNGLSKVKGLPEKADYFAVGGGTKSPLWSFLTAQILGTGLNLLPMAEPAVGAAVLAGISCGIFSDVKDALSITGGQGKEVLIDPEIRKYYGDLFLRFRELQPLVASISRICGG